MSTRTRTKPKAKDRLAPDPAIDALLNKEQVVAQINVGARKFHEMLSTGEFPPADRPIGKRRLWRRSTVAAWIAGPAKGA